SLSAAQRLKTALAGAELLLVLDNCEHLLAACAQLVGALLRACPNVRALCTSREPLGILGEVTWRVPSLSLGEAAQLFVERVTARQPDFVELERHQAAIAETCRRLDGIPLALELAAAHVPTLGIQGVVRRLDDRFALLTRGDRTAQPRH